MIEIEVDTGTNGDLLFHPLGERVRGRFDLLNVSGDTTALRDDFRKGVPGQVIAFDPATNTGYVREPLHSTEHAETREAIAKRQNRSPDVLGREVGFGQAVKEFRGAHAGTWLGWMRRAVASGLARVVNGKLPEIDPADMKKELHFTPRSDPKDATINQLLALLTAKLSPQERKDLASVLASGK